MQPPRHDDAIAALRAELSRLKGPARCRPLTELAAVLADRFWRAGMSAPAARADLDAAVEAMDEAYGYLDMKDPYRGPVAGKLGWFMAMRHMMYGTPERDQETAIHLLDESLKYPDQPQMGLLMWRTALGQLYLNRAVNNLHGDMQAVTTLLREGVPPATRTDIDRAVELLSSVVAADRVSAEVHGAAKAMLAMAEAMRDVLAGLGPGPGGGIDFGRMFQAFGAMQDLQNNPAFSAAARFGSPRGFGSPGGFGGAGGFSGAGAVPSIFNAHLLADLPPLDRPAPLVTGPEPDAPTTVRRRTPPVVPSVDNDTLRLDLLKGLADAAGTRLGDIPPDFPVGDDAPAVIAGVLLRPGEPPGAGAVDDLVGLATTIVHNGQSDGPVRAGVDRFLLGLALFLRGRDDDGGWGEEDSADEDSTDLHAAAVNLLAAAGVVPSDHPVAAAIPDVLDALLTHQCPVRGVLDAAAPMPAVVTGAPSEARSEAPAPSVAEVAAALHAIRADALVQLLPIGTGGAGRAPALLLDPSAERVDLIAWPDFIEPLSTALGPGPGPRRVVVVASGPLGRIPWAAVRSAAGRYTTDELTVTHLTSCRQVVELAPRKTLACTERAVFVANPRGDRESASVEAMVLRRIFYPHSTGLGRTIERVEGAGTPAEVLSHLPGPAQTGAGMLHLGCGLRLTGTAPALELVEAGEPALLHPPEIAARRRGRKTDAPGGIAVLPTGSTADCEGWVAVADALLAAGLTGVVGWLGPVPEPVAALMLFVLHARLVDDGLSPAAAVNAVHRWMLDPERVEPAGLPAAYAATLAGTDLADPAYWGALYHRGR